jgi:ligand-binding sensor domain-containing protein
MRYKYISNILAIVLLFQAEVLSSQPILQWENHVSFCEVNCLLNLKDSVLVGTDGGLASIQKSTLSGGFYNKMNSGLPDCRVNAMVKTDDDIVLATDCGLVFYNSGNWITYTTQNSLLTTNIVSALCYSDKLKSLWIGLDDGTVIKIFSGNWSYCSGISTQIPKCRILRLVVDSANRVWVAAHTSLIYYYDSLDWHIDPFILGLDYPGWPRELFIDHSGTLMAVDYGGIYRRTNSGNWNWYWGVGVYNDLFQHLKLDEGPAGTYWLSQPKQQFWPYASLWTVTDSTITNNLALCNNLTSMELTWIMLDDTLKWTGTAENGVDRIDSMTISNVPLCPDMMVNNISDLDFDVSGKVWLAFDAQDVGMSSYDGTSWNNFLTSATTIPPHEVNSISIDSNQVIWIATDSNGIISYNGTGWVKYNTITSNINADSVNTLTTDYHNQILVGLKDGTVQQLDNASFTTLISSLETDSSEINRIVPQNDTLFWVASKKSGLFRCNYTNTINFTVTNSGLPSNDVSTLIFDEYQNLWIGTANGLVVYNGSTWNVYDSLNSPLPGNHVSALTIGKDSSLWIGTRFSGLSRIQASNWTHFDKCNSPLVSNNITCLKTSADGRIFIGTTDGLSIIDPDYITLVKPVLPLSNVKVYPNPGSGIFQFEISLPYSQAGKFIIYDQLGNLILQKELNLFNSSNFSFTWDVTKSQVPSGIYFYSLTGNFKPVSGKIVVIR